MLRSAPAALVDRARPTRNRLQLQALNLFLPKNGLDNGEHLKDHNTQHLLQPARSTVAIPRCGPYEPSREGLGHGGQLTLLLQLYRPLSLYCPLSADRRGIVPKFFLSKRFAA